MATPYCDENMVREYGLPAWFPSVFAGGDGYAWEFHRDFDPILGHELSESYKRQPELYESIREGLGEQPSYGYNPAIEKFLAPIAEAQGKTPVELLFGLEPGREGLALSGSVPALAGILLLKPEPLEHIQAFLEHHNRDPARVRRTPEWEDVWQFGGRGKKPDPFAEWTKTFARSEHVATAVRTGYRGAELTAFITYEESILKLAVQGVSVSYSVPLIAALDGTKGDAYRVHPRDIDDFVLRCWEDGLSPEYAVLTLPKAESS